MGVTQRDGLQYIKEGELRGVDGDGSEDGDRNTRRRAR